MNTTKKYTEILLHNNKEVCLEGNKEEIKYMLMPCH